MLWVSQDLAGGRSWAPAAVSGILVAAGAAAIFVGPVAGVLVDRWDRIATMTLTETIRGVIAAGLAALSFLPSRDLPVWLWLAVMYLTVFLLGACGQFFTPARLASISETVHGEAERARATAMAEVTTSVAGMIGPPAAAPLMLAAGPHWALAANAASYAVSCLATRSLRPYTALRGRPAAPGIRAAGLLAEFREGLRIFARNRYVSVLLSVTVICQAGAAAVTTLNLFFLTGSLHAPARLYGTAEMAMGTGFILGAIAAGRLVRRAGARRVTWSGLLAAGVLIIGYALQRNITAALVVLGLYAAMISMLNTAAAPLLLDAAPREYLGRVLGVFSPVNQAASSVSMVGWGLADTVLRSFRATPGGIPITSVSLIFVIAGLLIIASGIRAFSALPTRVRPSRERPARERPAQERPARERPAGLPSAPAPRPAPRPASRQPAH